MSDWQTAARPMGTSVVWTKEEEDSENKRYVGEVVEGIFKERRMGVGKNNSTIYMIEHKDHGLLGLWDTKVLRDAFETGNGGQPIPVGNLVRVTYTGKKNSPNAVKPFHTFIVEFAPAPVNYQEAGAPNTGTPTPDNTPDTAGY